MGYHSRAAHLGSGDTSKQLISLDLEHRLSERKVCALQVNCIETNCIETGHTHMGHSMPNQRKKNMTPPDFLQIL